MKLLLVLPTATSELSVSCLEMGFVMLDFVVGDKGAQFFGDHSLVLTFGFYTYLIQHNLQFTNYKFPIRNQKSHVAPKITYLSLLWCMGVGC